MNCFLSSFHLDIDRVIITPAQPLLTVMLGEKVEWQCKTKASTYYTAQWEKVCVLPQSSLANPFMEYENLMFPRMENFLSSVRKQIPGPS